MSTLRVTTISNVDSSKSVPTNTVIDGSAKAWVNIKGTDTVTRNASFNVSSVVDNGTGDYTVNFATAFADANYVVAGVCGMLPTNSGWGDIIIADSLVAPSTTSVRIRTIGYTEFQDTTIVGIVVFR